MVNKEDLIDEAKKEDFEFSNQAVDVLLKTDKPVENAKKLINLAKSRKRKISGGDVLKFILGKDLPTSIVNSMDTGE